MSNGWQILGRLKIDICPLNSFLLISINIYIYIFEGILQESESMDINHTYLGNTKSLIKYSKALRDWLSFSNPEDSKNPQRRWENILTSTQQNEILNSIKIIKNEYPLDMSLGFSM
ncbi:hypothetical protein ACSBR1_029495 [Camellia fascicularis]